MIFLHRFYRIREQLHCFLTWNQKKKWREIGIWIPIFFLFWDSISRYFERGKLVVLSCYSVQCHLTRNKKWRSHKKIVIRYNFQCKICPMIQNSHNLSLKDLLQMAHFLTEFLSHISCRMILVWVSSNYQIKCSNELHMERIDCESLHINSVSPMKAIYLFRCYWKIVLEINYMQFLFFSLILIWLVLQTMAWCKSMLILIVKIIFMFFELAHLKFWWVFKLTEPLCTIVDRFKST